MLITIEMAMIETDSYEKCCNNDDESCACECEIVEKLVPRMGKWLLYIENSANIDDNLDKCSNIENILMDTVQDHHEDEVDEGECEHTESIGRIEGNSRGKKK